jgi:hypothetical protein
MAMFVHFAPQSAIGSIRRAGLKAGRFSRGIYAVPATPDFYASHQWLRELRRFHSGQPLVAVYFRLPGDAPVLFGPYGGTHLLGTADMAVGALMRTETPLGFEAIVYEQIAVSAITSVRDVRQVTGWRFFPAAKGRKPCSCPACLGRGEPFSQKIRAKYHYPD